MPLAIRLQGAKDSAEAATRVENRRQQSNACPGDLRFDCRVRQHNEAPSESALCSRTLKHALKRAPASCRDARRTSGPTAKKAALNRCMPCPINSGMMTPTTRRALHRRARERATPAYVSNESLLLLHGVSLTRPASVKRTQLLLFLLFCCVSTRCRRHHRPGATSSPPKTWTTSNRSRPPVPPRGPKPSKKKLRASMRRVAEVATALMNVVHGDATRLACRHHFEIHGRRGHSAGVCA